jgi:iron-sulfur cluster assembly protein
MISITSHAIDILRERLAGRTDCVGVRIEVRSSGCSGYSYDDSMAFLAGTRLEYVFEGLNEGFQFVNPNVTGECGCGESFYVNK